MSFLTDILLVVPKPEEFEYIKEDVFKDFELDTSIGKIFPNLQNLYRLKHKHSGLDVCAVVLNVMSNEVATLITERCITCLKPRLVIGIGIAGSLDKDVLLADVVISISACNYLSESKAIDIKKKGEKAEIKILTAPAAHAYRTEQKFITFFERENRFIDWQNNCKISLETLELKSKVKKKNSKKGEEIEIAREDPKIIVGHIASGPIVGASEIFKDFLNTVTRSFHAIEMEGAGVALSCHDQNKEKVDFILFRGISDSADKQKATLEDDSKNRWRNLAASNAARLVEFCLNNEDFINLLKPPILASNPLNIALFLSTHVHYVDSIVAGFQSELANIYADTKYWPHIIQEVGSPNLNDNELNKQKLTKLVTESKPEYIVTIGTAATKAAFDLYKNRKVIFLGVSEPEKAGFTGSNFMAGVSYGVAINETVKLLKEAFPYLTPTFVHNNSKIYSQDGLLFDALREQYDEDQVPELRLEDPIKFDDQPNRLYFGRFFLCKNMHTFTELNPDKPFVGVSIENIMKGAIMSIGYDTLEIGRVGAREILAAHHLAKKNLKDINVLEPKQITIGYNPTVANKIGHQILDGFRKKLTHTFD